MWKFHQFNSIIRWVIRVHDFSVFYSILPVRFFRNVHFYLFFAMNSIAIHQQIQQNIFSLPKETKKWTICCAFHVEEFHRLIFFHDGGWRKIAWACSFHNRTMLHVYTGDVPVWYTKRTVLFIVGVVHVAYAYSMGNESLRSFLPLHENLSRFR